ncbi:MAG: WD40 repeat domain-containing protein, partial [Nannocystaceae bacterium]
MTAHAVTDDLVFNARQPSTPTCDEAILSTLQEKATATNDNSQSLIRAIEATYKADERNCGHRAADIERQARELLRARDHQVFARIDSGVERLTLSPDDRSLAVVRGGNLEIFTLGEAEPNRLEAELVSSLTWSPDGRLIAGHRGGAVKIWDDYQPQKWQHSFDGPHRDDIVDIAVGREGNSFATVDSRGEVRLWSLSGGNKDQVIGQGQVASGSPLRAFIDAAEQILVVQTTESVKVWDLTRSRLGKGERIRIAAKPIAVALAADGGTIFASTGGGYTFNPNGDFEELSVGDTATSAFTFRIA